MTKISSILFALIAVSLIAVSICGAEDQGIVNNYSEVGSECTGPGGACIIADFVASPTSGTAPLRVQFIDTSTGYPTTYNWDFGDGSTSSGIAQPVHVYENPGFYTVTLTAGSLTGGSSTKVRTSYISVMNKIPLEADFLASPTNGLAPLSVEFTDCSKGEVTSWYWDFGDGSYASTSGPKHTYAKPGKYTVKLTVSSPTAGTSTKVKENYILVDPACTIGANFYAEPTSGSAPLTVRFTDCSTGKPTMWSWDFGDGSTEMVASPTHTFMNPGTYVVTLTASSQYCESSSKSLTITVTSPPKIIADFSGTPTSGNSPLTVRFTDCSTGNPTMWSWDFGDGSTDMGANPVHTYTNPGTYTVSLTASNQYGALDTKVKYGYITVQGCEPVYADFIGTPRSGSSPLTVQFTDLTTGNPTMWYWDFGDGTNDIVADPCHTYTQPGTYGVTLTASNQYGGTDTEIKTGYITVEGCEPFSADFVGTPRSGTAPLTVQFTDLSTGNPTMWSWDFGDGPVPMESCSGTECSNIAGPLHTYSQPGTYTVTLTISDQYGNYDTETKVNYITVTSGSSFDADFMATPTSGQTPLSVQFTDLTTGNPTMWYWDFGDGTNDIVADPCHTYTQSGSYTVTLTASNQYGDTDTEIKTGYIMVGSGCSITGQFDATPSIGPAPLTVQFTDRSIGGPTMWSWDFGDGATDMVANPCHTYTQAGSYMVTLTASSQYCAPGTATRVITVTGTPSGDYIPIYPGWNFISIPKKLAPGMDTASIFKGLDVAGHSMFAYDATRHMWLTLNSASPIVPLEGYWVYSARNDQVYLTYDTNPVQTPPTKEVKKGWNAVGFTGLTPLEAKYTFLSVENSWVNSVGFNAAGQKYDQMVIKGSNDQTLLYPFMGYWLYMSADGILAANAA